MLADLIEKITGKNYADVLKEKIFLPAGMKDSYFSQGQPSSSLAIGYINGQPEMTYPVENTIGANRLKLNFDIR